MKLIISFPVALKYHLTEARMHFASCSSPGRLQSTHKAGSEADT